MNLKFRHKVFLAFLLNSLLIVVCMLIIGRYYSERHFEEYVSKVEAERVTKLVDALRQEYLRRGNWDSVLQDPGLWFGLRWLGPGMPPGTGMTGPPPFPPGPLSMEREIVPPPPGELVPLPPGPPPEHPPIPPIALFDAEKRPLTPGGFFLSGQLPAHPHRGGWQVGRVAWPQKARTPHSSPGCRIHKAAVADILCH